ncbi:MAG: BatA domain-containing protein [Vicinamibacterales bacterium]|nr:BatA domain-containing protein [Vicinamibacterales bacterium]
MGVVWANPAALAGLALLAVPVLIHLLLRPEILHRRFPSLRFLPASRLASARRRRIHDWPLLLVRLAILALAVLALAGPILVTPSREQAWASQFVRAVVVHLEEGDAPSAAVDRHGAAIEEARAGAAVSTVIETSRLADGLVEAAAWLDAAPPGTRELVVMSAFRAGSVSGRDLAVIPPGAGVRLVALPAEARPSREVHRLASDGAASVIARHTLSLSAGRPSLSAAVARSSVDLPVAMEGGEADRQRLLAAMEAVLVEGFLVEGDPVPVIVAWGADAGRAPADVTGIGSPGVRRAFDRFVSAVGPAPRASDAAAPAPWTPIWPGRLIAAEQDERLVISGQGELGVDEALGIARAAIRAAYAAPQLDSFEPRTIAPEAREAWMRPAARGDAAAVARAGDTDARVLWALVLVLLGVEQWMRRARRGVAGDADVPAEARVA